MARQQHDFSNDALTHGDQECNRIESRNQKEKKKPTWKSCLIALIPPILYAVFECYEQQQKEEREKDVYATTTTTTKALSSHFEELLNTFFTISLEILLPMVQGKLWQWFCWCCCCSCCRKKTDSSHLLDEEASNNNEENLDRKKGILYVLFFVIFAALLVGLTIIAYIIQYSLPHHFTKKPLLELGVAQFGCFLVAVISLRIFGKSFCPSLIYNLYTLCNSNDQVEQDCEMNTPDRTVEQSDSENIELEMFETRMETRSAIEQDEGFQSGASTLRSLNNREHVN